MRLVVWLACFLALVPSSILPAQSIPQFESEIVPIFARYCTHCHGQSSPVAGLDLTNPLLLEKGGASGPALLKHSPEESLLYRRLVDGTMPPAGQDKPTEREIEVIRQWIGAGAPTVKFYAAQSGEANQRSAIEIKAPAVTQADREFWAFRKLVDAEPPRVQQQDRVRTAVDAFLLGKLEEKGLGFSSEADRVLLIRRLYFDLIGLPPSPEAVDTFLADGSPAAYERLVDQLLSSPHFGERWGRHWLDEAGHVDTLGGDTDFVAGRQAAGAPGKWKYRDYVVGAFNANTPYDRFLIEQLAGDELVNWRSAEKLTPEMRQLLTATGFLRVAADDTGQDVLNTPDIRYGILQRTVQTFASNVLGLTVGCAQCHDHKYDPVSQLDYYRLTAVFTPAYNPQKWLEPKDRALPDASPAEKAAIDRASEALDQRIRPFNRKLNALYHPYKQRLLEKKLMQVPEVIREDLRVALKSFENELRPAQQYLKEKFEPVVMPREEEIQALLAPEELHQALELRSRIDALEVHRRSYGVVQGVVDTGPPPPTYFLMRGNYLTPGPKVKPGIPAVLADPGDAPLLKAGGAAGESSGRRLALARWLTDPDSSGMDLVARVRANRVWQRLFGEGIVTTSDNFGRSGAQPTHPELLDWLSRRFIAKGWRMKSIIRLLVTSTAYRQRSQLDRADGFMVRPSSETVASIDPMQVDPSNRLLWRMRLRRLESEIIRDAMMAVSGKLNRKMGGPAIGLENHPNGSVVISGKDLAHPRDRWRRSLYVLSRRTYNLTMLSVFDQPKISTNCVRRDTSAVVLQTLTMLNNDFVLDQTRAFAARVAKQAGDTPQDRIQLAFRLALAREPSAGEISWSQELLGREQERYRAAEGNAEAARFTALASLCQMLFNSNEFLHVG